MSAIRRASMRRGLRSVLIGAALCVILPPSPGWARVLYTSPGLILSSTSTSSRIAWAAQLNRPGPLFRVYRRRAFTGAPIPLQRAQILARSVPWVRLAGARAYWDETDAGNTLRADDVFSTVRMGRPSSVGDFTVFCGFNGCSPNTTGKQLGPVAIGDGALTYSVFAVAIDGGGNATITGGVVRRAIVSPSGAVTHRLVPGAPGAALLAQSGRNLLEAPAAPPVGTTVKPGSTIQLRDDRTGALRWSATTPGTVTALGISGLYACALVKPPIGAPRIVAYTTASGAVAHTLPLRSPVLAVLGVSGPRVVFEHPRGIVLWNVRHNLVRRLQRTQRVPRDLTFAGRLVTWNTGRSKILGILLPPVRH